MSRARLHASAADRQRAYRARKRNAAEAIVTLNRNAETDSIIVRRATAPARRWTFGIKPIAALLARYVGDGRGWVDPFAGMHSPAELTNDLNPAMPTQYHLLAEDFCRLLPGPFRGVLLDPPYSYRQISDCYRDLHQIDPARFKKATSQDTTAHFYNAVMNAICDKIQPDGYAITCGWNSNGFGRRRGFSLIEVLIVAHGSGSHRNDTIVTVEQKRGGDES